VSVDGVDCEMEMQNPSVWYDSSWTIKDSGVTRNIDCQGALLIARIPFVKFHSNVREDFDRIQRERSDVDDADGPLPVLIVGYNPESSSSAGTYENSV